MLTRLDKKILEEIQNNFPIVQSPWKQLGRKLHLSEKDLIERIKILQTQGYIRYIGVIFDLNKLGLKSTLLAMNVPTEKMKSVVRIINNYPYVSHNYLRNGKFNVWFTLTARSDKELDFIINDIKKKTSIKDILDLRTKKVFKINVSFKL
jgi:DNA-binding Lrp family transcriptional regulator